MTAPASAEAPAVPRHVRTTQWIWLIGTALTVLSSLYLVVLAATPVTLTALVVTLVQAALAVPAALALPRGKRWARMVLLVLAAISIGSLYNALKMQAWATLVINLALGSTLGLLHEAGVRAFFGLPAEPWLRRRVRGRS
ncbi:hypothetical protein GCM10027174_29080 [Salinifilum aidingensis]